LIGYIQFGISSLIKDNRTINTGRRYNVIPEAERVWKEIKDKLAWKVF